MSMAMMASTGLSMALVPHGGEEDEVATVRLMMSALFPKQ
jgi:hypothetical protein